MSWLFDNLFVTMYGPQFLVVYVVLVVVTIVVCRTYARALDPSRGMASLPLPKMPDPHEAAFLRGGGNEALRLAGVELSQRGYLVAKEEGGQHRVERNAVPPDPAHLARLERAVFGVIVAPRTAGELFADSSLRAAVQTQELEMEKRLRDKVLLMPADRRTSALMTWEESLAK